MLGQFLEFSTTTGSIASALEFYRALGFAELTAGENTPDPYAAVWDGAIAIGMHPGDTADPALTFVRPDLQKHVRGLRRLGIELRLVALADDEFHRVAFRDPNGLRVVLLEARTFSPAHWPSGNVSTCGTFVEASIATPSLAESATFWQRFGLDPVAEGQVPHPWLRIAGHGLSLGFHQTFRFAPGLTFAAPNLAARRDYLKLKGIDVRSGAPVATGSGDSASVAGPVGSMIYVVEASPSSVDATLPR
jgi:catechol 2,3-dioxygenase-like lactoylglutathione lyase family enzyme